MLRRWIQSWEQAIFAVDDDDRRPSPFGWGVEHLDLDDLSGELPAAGDERGRLLAAARLVLTASSRFFTPPPPAAVDLDGDRLTFDAPVPTRHAENRRAAGRLFEASSDRGRAVVVIPQWNAASDSHVRACGILNRFGMTALRLTLPYHEDRRPASMRRADPMVSPQLGLTLRTVRLAVLEVRQAVAWLRDRGYERIGLLGSSLGSCIGFLAMAHEPAVRAVAFNHVAAWFADVVWDGMATRHVRASLQPHVDLATLRAAWAPISPASYVGRLRGRTLRILMVSGAYDQTFLPEQGRALAAALRQMDVDHRRVVLPCGHYTLGKLPFYLVDAALVASFLRRHLSA